MNRENNGTSKKPKSSKPVGVGKYLGEIHLLDGGAPRYELRIDRDGRWFHEGIEIVREDIRSLFSRNLIRSEDGGYCIRIGNDECRVVVEDTPFVIVRVTRERDGDKSCDGKPQGRLMLLLNDGTQEPLDGRTITFKDSNVPYCYVRANLEARFSRPAYYQLAEFIRYDEMKGKYFLVVGDNNIELSVS